MLAGVTGKMSERRRPDQIAASFVTPSAVGMGGPSAGYRALLHICGPKAVSGGGRMPEFNVDFFTLWNATGPELRAVLRRDGDRVVCPELGTRWPTAA